MFEREPHQLHRDEREEHRDGIVTIGNDRGRDVPEEDEDDERDDDHLHDQLVLQGVDRALDQVRAVVGGDDLHALGQAGLELVELRPSRAR